MIFFNIIIVFGYGYSTVCGRILNNGTDFSEENHLENTNTSFDLFNTTKRVTITSDDTLAQNRKLADFNKGYFDKLYMNLPYCPKPAKCQVLNSTTCMGVKLPYTSSTLDLTGLASEEQVHEKLQLYQYLRYVPKCWAVIQPFLCSLYMPKCENGSVFLPSREMCNLTMKPCKIFYNTSIFPSFMRCEDQNLFPSPCKNDIQELKFNMTGFCMDPLVKTDQPRWFFPDVEGCGLRCKDALYTEKEHQQIHKLVAYCVLFCIFMNLFTIITFIIDWKTANKYPALAIFYINICFFISYSGWLVQFLGSETREDIVCKKDGTLRKSEPSASENLSCVIVFVMVYYFLIAGLVWFVIFSYAWHRSSLQALGKIQDRVDKKRAYFHLVAWSLPLILTITTMALCEIDGDYVTGICFVGLVSAAARTGLLLAPLAAAMIVSGYITVRGLILLIRVKIESREIISAHSSSKIRSNIVRMGVFALFMLVFCIITFVYHGYTTTNSEIWEESLRGYILCKLTSFSSDYSHCRQESRPSVAMLQLQLLAIFGAGVAMASWVWCTATIHLWTRYIRRKFHCEVEEPMKLQKHKIIAQAFAKRRIFNQGGRISIECQNHTDPVGLHFDLNSAASNELSTTWAANLPRFVNRRGAVPNEVTCSVSSNNQSVDSEMSYSVRHVSIESRRNSGDSQLSVQIAELKATRKVNGRRHRSRLRHKRDFKRGKTSKNSARRESSTSLDSHFGAQLLNVLTNNGNVKSIAPNLKRRAGNAGLDGQHVNNLLSNGKLVIPYVNNVRSGSEDENVSVTISESKFNVVVSNHNFDLNDQLVMKSLREGLNIKDLNSSTDSEDEERKKDKEKHSRSRRESKNSRRSRMKYSSQSDSFDEKNSHSDSSSCPELKQLVQSSQNSGMSVGCEKNRGSSKQSKNSIDVAVQANARDIVTHTSAFEMQDLSLKDTKYKSKKAKTDENRQYKKYKDYLNNEESKPLRQDSNRKYSDNCSEEEDNLIKQQHRNKDTRKKQKYINRN